MRQFNVLDQNERIPKRCILEASAGTGKTFSIENLVVRFIVERNIRLDRILLVTFTRAATRDLKVRIRQNLLKAIDMLEGLVTPVDFLVSYLTQREEKLRALRQALLLYDDAKIDTIHGFCSRSLREHVFEGDMPLTSVAEQARPTKTLLVEIVKDFFRTGVDRTRFSYSQIKRLNRSDYGDPLEIKILKCSQKPFEASSTTTFERLFEQFKGFVETSPFPFETVLNFYQEHKSSYKMKKNSDEWMERFATIRGTKEDFDFLILEGFLLEDFFSGKNLKKRSKDTPEPAFYTYFYEHLAPIIREARSKEMVLSRMVHDVQKMTDRYLKKNELWRFDDLLTGMVEALKTASFVTSIRSSYDVVIVDEFQDTDALQWNIFRTLFALDEWPGSFIVVGDPKQSIYAFRSADIYTYLEVVKCFGEASCASLTTNYRSHPELIRQLNAFFSIDGIFSLPETESALQFLPALANENFVDHQPSCKAAVHVFSATDESKRFSFDRVEKNDFHPFIVDEMIRLKKDSCFSDMAVLVRTQAQGRAIADVLRKHGIPVQMQKTEGLAKSRAACGLMDVIEALIHPRDLSRARLALSGTFFGYEDATLSAFTPEEVFLKLACIEKSSIPRLISTLKELILEAILVQEEGPEIFADLTHLFQMLLMQDAKSPMSLHEALDFLKKLSLLEFEEDPSLNRTVGNTGQGVTIMTLHASKGLEFEIVFALGLFKRTHEAELLIPDRSTRQMLPVLTKEDPRYLAYCEEIDAEKMRLMYVALTRAKKRVYIPYVRGENIPKAKEGAASPIELYAEKNPAFLELFTHRDLNVNPPQGAQWQGQVATTLVPPPCVNVEFSTRTINSFSSLTKGHTPYRPTLDPPRSFINVIKDRHTLPAGPETGTLLHELLESFPFEKVEIPQLVYQKVQGTSFEGWEQVFIELIEEVTALSLLQGITEEECYKEIEFLYPIETGLLKGVIDLVFRKGNLYYIIDWKSNWLGPDPSFYDDETLSKAMNEHQYHLQADIYHEALRRYIEVIEQRNFEECFGGVYYVFLRGMALCEASRQSPARMNVE